MTTLPSEVKAALREIKYKISVGIVERRSEELDCTPEEYGKVYDSEKHELMLNKIIRSIQPEIERLVVEARIDELDRLVAALDLRLTGVKSLSYIPERTAQLTQSNQEEVKS